MGHLEIITLAPAERPPYIAPDLKDMTVAPQPPVWLAWVVLTLVVALFGLAGPVAALGLSVLAFWFGARVWRS